MHICHIDLFVFIDFTFNPWLLTVYNPSLLQIIKIDPSKSPHLLKVFKEDEEIIVPVVTEKQREKIRQQQLLDSQPIAKLLVNVRKIYVFIFILCNFGDFC